MLSLTIHHNIHLTREQRYSLHEGNDVATIGISVPVWHSEKLTSEPAKEVFCWYYLKNPRKEIPIRILTDGYEICLPYREGQGLTISDEEYRALNTHDPDKLRDLLSQTIQEVSSKKLIDMKDGGSGGFLNYRELNKVPRNEGTLSIMHHIVISKVEDLTNSIY